MLCSSCCFSLSLRRSIVHCPNCQLGYKSGSAIIHASSCREKKRRIETLQQQEEETRVLGTCLCSRKNIEDSCCSNSLRPPPLFRSLSRGGAREAAQRTRNFEKSVKCHTQFPLSLSLLPFLPSLCVCSSFSPSFLFPPLFLRANSSLIFFSYFPEKTSTRHATSCGSNCCRCVLTRPALPTWVQAL